MGKNRREILDRLEALEQLASRREEERDRGRGGHGRRDGGHRGDGSRGGRGGREQGDSHDEKRVIDTIVRLVGERVDEMLRSQSRREDERRGRDSEREREILQAVVSLVSENVQEIVADELDRRGLGAADEAGPPARRASAAGGSRSSDSE